MPIFYVTPVQNPGAVLDRLKEVLPNESDRYVLAPDKVFVHFDGTTLELSEKLGIADGSVGTGIILNVGLYHGRAPTTLWEWIGQKSDKK